MRDRPEKVFHIYIMASKPHGVLYVGDLFADVLRDAGFEW
jgi:hypothetical protein